MLGSACISQITLPHPSRLHSSQTLTCCLGLALPWPETELTLLLSGRGGVEWALHFRSAGWIQVPAVAEGKALMFAWRFLIFPSTYVHSHLLPRVVQWRTRRGREPAHLTEKINEHPGGSTLLLFLEVRRASTHWLLSLTLSYAALRTTLRNLYGGRGDMGAIFHRDLSGSSQVFCPHSFSTPIQSPGWSSWLSYPVINELSVIQAWGCSGQVKGRSKEMVWMVRSRISHVIEPSTITCTRQPVSRYLIWMLGVGGMGLGNLVLRHGSGRDLPKRWSGRFIFSCTIAKYFKIFCCF